MAAEELDIASTVDDIASDLGLGGGEPSHDDDPSPADDPADAPIGDEPTTDAPAEVTEPPAEALPVARAAPKAWAKEQHERWGKIDKETQDYIEHREKQMLEGLSQYGDRAKYGETIQKALAPYEQYIKANNIDAPRAVTALFEAHKGLAEGSPEQRTAYLVKVAKNYGLDLAKAAALSTGNGAEEPAYVKDLRERQEKLEREHSTRTAADQKAIADKVTADITAFADAKDEKGVAKHPYFDECSEDIVALIHAGHTLEKAYEKAVYANPVTRAKELARLQTESEAALRAKAKKEADDARNGRKTNVNSKDTRRAPTASKTGKWEDTLDETLKEIKARPH